MFCRDTSQQSEKVFFKCLPIAGDSIKGAPPSLKENQGFWKGKEVQYRDARRLRSAPTAPDRWYVI
jgi:hypothetical protein